MQHRAAIRPEPATGVCLQNWFAGPRGHVEMRVPRVAERHLMQRHMVADGVRERPLVRVIQLRLVTESQCVLGHETTHYRQRVVRADL